MRHLFISLTQWQIHTLICARLVVYDSTEVFVCFCVCIWRVYSLRRICGASTWLDGRVWQNALDSLGTAQTVFVISNKVLSTNHQRIANNRPIISPEIGDNPSLQSFGLFWHLWTRWNGSHSCHPGCKFMSAKSFNADALLYDVILFHRTTEFQKQKNLGQYLWTAVLTCKRRRTQNVISQLQNSKLYYKDIGILISFCFPSRISWLCAKTGDIGNWWRGVQILLKYCGNIAQMCHCHSL